MENKATHFAVWISKNFFLRMIDGRWIKGDNAQLVYSINDLYNQFSDEYDKKFTGRIEMIEPMDEGKRFAETSHWREVTDSIIIATIFAEGYRMGQIYATPLDRLSQTNQTQLP
jgi:hypothetical protein